MSKFLFLIICLFLVSFLANISAQIGISEDKKKNLLKSVNPSNGASITTYQSAPILDSKSIMDNKYLDTYNSSKSSSKKMLDIEVSHDLKIQPSVFSYISNKPANLLPNGSVTPVFMGGHFIIMPTGGLVFPSGLNLTGGKQKILSEQSKSILQNVFGMELDK